MKSSAQLIITVVRVAIVAPTPGIPQVFIRLMRDSKSNEGVRSVTDWPVQGVPACFPLITG